MTENLKLAKKILLEEECSCVAVGGRETIRHHKRGVAPLLDMIDKNISLRGFSVADKVVGKGAGFLYLILKPEEIYADVISESAFNLLSQRGLCVYYGRMVPAIKNRDKTGFCPVESSVISLNDEKEAYEVILKTLENLKRK